jgi:hypothetical protein
MYFFGERNHSEDREGYGDDDIKTDIKKARLEGMEQTDLAQHTSNLCAVANAVMNILPSAAFLPNSISGSANPSGEPFFCSIYCGSSPSG